MARSDARKAAEDLVGAIRKVFKNYTPTARRKAWSALTTSKGKNIIDRLSKDTSTPVTGLPRLLSFREWEDEQSQSDDPN